MCSYVPLVAFEVPPPEKVRYRQIRFTRFCRGSGLAFHEFERTFGEIFAALAAGNRVLVHCCNGRHRAPLACALVLLPFFPSRHDVLERVQALRRLADFTETRSDLMTPSDCASLYREASCRLARRFGVSLLRQRIMEWHVLARRLEDGSADVLVAKVYKSLRARGARGGRAFGGILGFRSPGG